MAFRKRCGRFGRSRRSYGRSRRRSSRVSMRKTFGRGGRLR